MISSIQRLALQSSHIAYTQIRLVIVQLHQKYSQLPFLGLILPPWSAAASARFVVRAYVVSCPAPHLPSLFFHLLDV